MKLSDLFKAIKQAAEFCLGLVILGFVLKVLDTEPTSTFGLIVLSGFFIMITKFSYDSIRDVRLKEGSPNE